MRVDPVDQARRGATGGERRIVRRGHEIPELRDDRIHTEPARVARLAAAGGRLIVDAIHGNREWIEIELGGSTSRCRERYNACTHQSRGCAVVEADDIWKPAALIIEEKICLSAPELGRQRAADSGAETVSMSGRKGRSMPVDQNVVVPPEIGGAHIASKIKLVQRPMERIGSALSHHLDLAAGRIVEFRGLVARADLEFLDTFDGSGHHAGRRAAGGAGATIAIARNIGGIVPGHVVAVVASVELEAVLIRRSTGHVARKRHSNLEHGERRRIASQVRQQLELVIPDR